MSRESRSNRRRVRPPKGRPLPPLLLLAMALAGGACGEERLAYPEANVVLIGLDTVRADHLGLYGRTPSPTPALDALAAESIVFDRAYSTAPWTLPAFGSVFTGLLPSEHGLVDAEAPPLAGDRLTLAEVLHAAGYHTHGFVAVDWLTDSFGLDQGFETQEVFVGGPVSNRYGRYEERVHAFLRRPPARPYFLFLHIYDAHAPYAPPAPYDGIYYRGDPGDPANDSLSVIYGDANRAMRPPEKLYRWLDGVTDIQYPLSQYAAQMAYLDARLERLLAVLRQTGELERTVLVVLADHGEHLVEHDIYFTHYLPYRETLHVPLLVRLPDGRRGDLRVEHGVSTADLFPTLIELLGLPEIRGSYGRSLMPLLRTPGARPERRWLFAEWGGPRRHVRAIWNHEVKLLRFAFGEGPSWELYDLRSDPAETASVHDERPRLRRRLDAVLEQRYAGIGAPGEGEPLAMDPEVRQRLEALGYL